jgi:hypothetical protein
MLRGLGDGVRAGVYQTAGSFLRRESGAGLHGAFAACRSGIGFGLCGDIAT